MRKLTTSWILFAFILNANVIFPQTIIPPSSNVSGTWDVLGSPYIVQGTATVSGQDTLIINPGVVVKLDTGNAGGLLSVYGVLLVNGNINDSIYFTRNADTGYWKAIHIANYTEPLASITYAKIEYGSKRGSGYSEIRGAIAHSSTNTTISNNTISNNRYYGIAFSGTYSPYDPGGISENIIVDNQEGGIYLRGQKPTILNNIIENNCGHGIYADYLPNARSKIIGNTISNNDDWGIYFYWSDPIIVSNIIVENGGGGIRAACTDIINNVIAFNNGHGVLSRNYSKIYNNTIVYNSGSGIYDDQHGFEIINSIVYGNSDDLSEGSSGTSKTIEGSLLGETILDGSIIQTGRNIFGYYPGFIDEINFNFQLQHNSICINNGTADTTGLGLPSVDLAGSDRVFANIVDIGAFEFNEDFIRLETPNGKVGLKNDNIHPITWISNVTDLDIDYWSDVDQSWHSIETNYSNSGSLDWNVPASLILDSCLIRISDHNNASLFDISDYSFSIKEYTEVADSSFVRGIWKLDYSPYIVMREAIILTGDTLYIEPGVNVLFETGVNHDYQSPDFDLGFMHIYGILKAQGTENDSIVFKGCDDFGEWGMLLFRDFHSNNSHLSYCNISGASNITNYGAQTMEGAVSFYNSDAFIEKSNIAKNYGSGIHCYAAAPEIQHNIIKDNDERGIFGYGSSPVIALNKISFNTGIGIFMVQYSMSPKIINNIINNNDQGIRGYIVCHATIYGNLIYENDYGIYMRDASRPTLKNNTIINNNVGIYTHTDDCDINVYNSIIWNNSTNFELWSYADIGNSVTDESSILGIAFDMGGNICSQYPEFYDTINQDYRIKGISPCLDRGSFNISQIDSLDLESNPRINHGRIDIGAYEYQQTGDWLHVVRPNIAEFFEGSTIDTIRWLRNDSLSAVSLEFSLDKGLTWDFITSSTENDGEYLWNTPYANTCSAQIRIQDLYATELMDLTDSTFHIATNLIRDGEEVSGTWTLDNSPYTVEKRAIVPENQTLTIEPGVEVWFRSGSNYRYNYDSYNMGVLKVEGNLVAEGTDNNPIVFTHLCSDGFWGMIYMIGNNCTLNLKHCSISFGSVTDFGGYWADVSYGSVSFRLFNSMGNIENCEFLFNDYYAVDIWGGSNINIRNSSFYLNLLGGGIAYRSTNSNFVNFVGNEIYDNLWNGIYCNNSSPAITNNTITTTPTKVDNQSLFEIAQPLFINLEKDSLQSSPKARFLNEKKSNAFYENGENFTYGLTCESNSDPSIYNSIFYDNGTNFNLSSNSNPSIGHSLIGDASLPTGMIDLGNNIFDEDPQFTEVGEHPFSLKENSPCIDAGNPDTTGLILPPFDLAGNPRIFNDQIIDIGAYEYQGGQRIDLDLKVFLEGPFIIQMMVPSLNVNGYLPYSQPYNLEPWNYLNQDNVPSIPIINIVDWVLVDLRKSNAGPAYAVEDSTVNRRSAFILNTGQIVDLDGSSLLSMSVPDTVDLYAVIYHRSHLPIISANPLVSFNDIYSYDFTTGSDKVYGGVNACKELGPDVWGMIGGNAIPDDQINNMDKNDGWLLEIGNSGYFMGDLNMNGTVEDTDKENTWEPNTGKGSKVQE